MEVNFDVNKLDGMKRGELQKLCKSVGIKANSKNAQLIQALKEYASQFSGKAGESSACQEQPSQNSSYVLEANEAVTVKETETVDKQQEEGNSDSYKKQLMDELDKKVEEKMPVECKIPRFVQFINNDSSVAETNKTPAAKWNKIHQSQFEKMDSIDVYLEKKRKRMEGFNQSVKRAKTVVDACKSGKENSKTPTRKSTGVTRKSQGKAVEVTFKPTITNLNKSATFVFGSPAAKPFFQPGSNQPKVSTATSAAVGGKILKLKSPKGFKPVLSGSVSNGGKPKTPMARKSFAATTTAGENKPKTPANPARKSTAVTPFRFLPANVPAPPTPTPRKKFDLQASLAKPLTYKPHTGKLKPVSSFKEECRPTVSEAKLKSRDVKSAKVTSREERRKKGVKNRENKRANTLSRRRGLAC